MCVPACHEQIVRAISRRSFLRNASVVAATGLVAGCASPTDRPAETESEGRTIRYSRVVDLTHTLHEDFPTYFGARQLTIANKFTAEKDGFNLNEWTINEHTGTHLDSPFHFNGENSADRIPIESLVGPLAVIDLRARAAESADAQLTPDDIRAWESQHGPLPQGAIVALNSGWDARVMDSAGFRNADPAGTMHFPGFHVEVADFLLAERNVSGVIVDTLSLDYGMSPDFAFHFKWLTSNHWGIEGAANLSQLPASGATVVVGGPKIQGATGGPSRVIAFA